MGTLTISGSSSGLGTGQKVMGPITITGSNMVGTILDVTLASGDNTFSLATLVSSGATAVLINLGNAPAATVKARTNLDTGTGLGIAPYTGTGFAAFPIVAGVTTLILNSSESLTGVELSFV